MHVPDRLPKPWLAAALAAVAVAALAGLPLAAGHGVFEAQELEVHAISDEGTDAIEAYGGFDITEVFLGAAHVEGLGDAVYVRLELYGLVSDVTAAMPWTVQVSFDTPSGRATHFLRTTDGATFAHDFADLQFEVEPDEHEVHVQRAVLPIAEGHPRPGGKVEGLLVESYWGTDLRDVAPGGIPAPFTGGAVDVPEPNAVAGAGFLSDGPVPTTDAYFGAVGAMREDGVYTLRVANALRQGGQHIQLAVADGAGWNVTVAKGVESVPANGTATLEVRADPSGATAPLRLQVTSDIGGRLELRIDPDGSVHARGASLLAPAAPSEEQSPAPAALAAAVALLAAARRRRA